MAGAETAVMQNDHQYIEFERQTFQDNIVLCDAKSGILFGFGSLLLMWCLDKLLTPGGAGGDLSPFMTRVETVLYALAVLSLAFTIGLTWRVIRPRISQADDYIYWGSKIFTQSEGDFIKSIHNADPEVLAHDMLRQLHVLAGICRNKYANFRRAVIMAEFSAALVFVSLCIRIGADFVRGG